MKRSNGFVVAAALSLIVGVALHGAQATRPPAADEKAIAAWIDVHNGEALSLLERAVNINSGTDNLAGVRQVGTLFKAEFDALGFKTTWVDGAEFGRAGHLVATHAASGPKILLIGHLDTVFPADSPFQKFERRDGNTAKGPGTFDMQGGGVAGGEGFEALHAGGVFRSRNMVDDMNKDAQDTDSRTATATRRTPSSPGAAPPAGSSRPPARPRTRRRSFSRKSARARCSKRRGFSTRSGRSSRARHISRSIRACCWEDRRLGA